MDTVDDQAVVDHDEVKDVILNFMYRQPYLGCYWENLRRLLAEQYEGWADISGLLGSIIWALKKEGRVVHEVKSGPWYQLTTTQWISMTRSRQSCSGSSTNTQSTKSTGERSTLQ